MASIRFFMIGHRPVDAMRRHDKPRVIDPRIGNPPALLR
jgi:hypothetical protein